MLSLCWDKQPAHDAVSLSSVTARLSGAEHSGHRLLDVLWDDSRLYMILEYLDVDLHQHMDADPEASLAENVRVRYPIRFSLLQGDLTNSRFFRGCIVSDIIPKALPLISCSPCSSTCSRFCKGWSMPMPSASCTGT